jgi:hypothetical protein
MIVNYGMRFDNLDIEFGQRMLACGNGEDDSELSPLKRRSWI